MRISAQVNDLLKVRGELCRYRRMHSLYLPCICSFRVYTYLVMNLATCNLPTNSPSLPKEVADEAKGDGKTDLVYLPPFVFVR